MNLTLFKDKGLSLNHREMDDNFLSILETMQKTVTMQDTVIGPTMTKGSSRRSIDNTVKMAGMRPQGTTGMNYTYAKDTGKLYRKAAYRGAHEVDEQGNTLECYYVGSGGNTTITPDGKYLISVQVPHSIHVTSIATGNTTEYSIDTWWADTNMNDVCTMLIKDNFIYVLSNSASLYHILKIAINPNTGALSPIDKISTYPKDWPSYYNAAGDGKIAMSCAGVNNWIFDSEDNTITTVVTPYVSGTGTKLAYLPIGFDSNGKAHFLRMDLAGGSAADIHNIYVQNNEGGVDPIAVSDAVRNELALFCELYSYSRPKTTFQLIDMPSCKLYGSYVYESNASPFVLYNPDTIEFLTLVDHTEAVFISKGE